MVAHEFSHILNGDMRLDLRMLAPLYGLLALALLGRLLLQVAFSSPSKSSSSSDSKVTTSRAWLCWCWGLAWWRSGSWASCSAN